MIIIIISSTEPAPLFSAFRTCHMIASIYFLSSITTMRTFYHIILFHIFLQLCITYTPTCNTYMTHSSTFKTHLLSTWVTFSILFPSTTPFLSLRISITLYLWTPFQIWVFFNLYIKYKLFIFFIYRISPKILNIIFCKLLFATKIHTIYINYFSFFNINR